MKEVWVCPKHGRICDKGKEKLIPYHRIYRKCYRVLELEEIRAGQIAHGTSESAEA
jgi:hypothetical protein